MLGTSARLLRLLSLFQAQRYWSGPALAERLEVTPRTLRRDVDRLRSLGYPVHSTPGTDGGYQLGQGANLPPLLLDDDEAVAVAVGLRSAAGGALIGIEEASVRALLKLEQVLPARLARRVAALHTSIVPLAKGEPNVDARTLTAIAAAARDCQLLRFNYRDRGGSASTRWVEPHRLVATGRLWYLAAWDTARTDWRTFRVDRITPPLAASGSFSPRKPPGGDFAAYVAKSVTWSPYRYRAKVTIHAPAEVVAERVPPTIGALEPVGPQTCLLSTGASSLEGLAMYLAMIGADFEVHEPPELIESLRLLKDRLGRAISCKESSRRGIS